MDQKVKRLVEKVEAHLHERYGDGIKRVILYGSYARGEATEHSDVDVLVLVARRAFVHYKQFNSREKHLY